MFTETERRLEVARGQGSRGWSQGKSSLLISIGTHKQLCERKGLL